LTRAANAGLMNAVLPSQPDCAPKDSGMDEVESVILSAIEAKISRRPMLSDDLLRIGIDSLAMAEIALEIEERLGLRLSEGVLDHETVGQLIEHVATLRQKQSPPA
jgi:acyl carrier protein